MPHLIMIALDLPVPFVVQQDFRIEDQCEEEWHCSCGYESKPQGVNKDVGAVLS